MSVVFPSFVNAMPTVLLQNGSCQNLLQFDHGARVGLLQLFGAARGLAGSHQPAIRRQQAVEGLCHGVAVPVSRVGSSESAWEAGGVGRLLLPDGKLVGSCKAPCRAGEVKPA